MTEERSIPGQLDAEDQKLITLARSARMRTGAAHSAAVRDRDGRTYVASAVDLPSLQLSALQVAVAMAVSSGAPGLEAAVVLGGDPASTAPDADGEQAVREAAGDVAGDATGDVGGDATPKVRVIYAGPDGTVL